MATTTGAAPTAPPKTLADLLVAATRRNPDGSALVTPTGQVTYRELWQQSLRLASYLTEAGVCPGDRVVICLPKREELVVGIFGTLLSGACYVPVDHGTPAERIRLIVDDAAPAAVVCTARTAARAVVGSVPTARLADDSARHVLVCTGPRGPVAEPADGTAVAAASWARTLTWAEVMRTEPRADLPPGDPAARAYILYTSGSSGRPKGVVHTHRSALAFVDWAAGHLGLTSVDRLSQHASPSFDLTVFDFFCSAAAAATLVLVPEWLFGRVGKTRRFVANNGITVWYSVPSALLGDAEDTSAGASADVLAGSALRRVVFAGETLPNTALRAFVRRLPPGCSTSNWYGPTETNVCTFHDVTAADLKSDQPIPIGLPCPYATVRIRDPGTPGDRADGLGDPSGHRGKEDGDRPTRGELLVVSASTMAEYWNLPEFTARAFAGETGPGRSYRTGDVVDVRDGRLVFLGRHDRMVKIRGYRVQPEEVELALHRHPAVTDAAVMAVAEGNVARLVAAVVAPGAADDAVWDELLAELRQACDELLPAYMRPSAIVRLPVLPRGDRGKVDLASLPALLVAHQLVEAGGQGPAAEDERAHGRRVANR